MKTYCITGISGYIGQLLATKLARDAETRVVGIDVKTPEGLDNIVFHKIDIRDPAITDILQAEAVDTLIHLAFYTHPEGDPKEALSVNIDGTKNILGAVVEAGARKFVMASSAAAYGSHPDNPVPMSEDEPLRPNEYFYYSWHKAEQERLAGDVLGSRPDIKTVILRPCHILGAVHNAASNYLRLERPMTMMGFDPMVQVVHEEDVVEALVLALAPDAR
ncbi:MAG: NAD-dependent epimerase/dehydratase family protein, partial [Proteobacteria bacterium]|nr:NAD-dependent epimerase/dehydratase family protein [Pseudomonadota bacterium]